MACDGRVCEREINSCTSLGSIGLPSQWWMEDERVRVDCGTMLQQAGPRVGMGAPRRRVATSLSVMWTSGGDLGLSHVVG